MLAVQVNYIVVGTGAILSDQNVELWGGENTVWTCQNDFFLTSWSFLKNL